MKFRYTLVCLFSFFLMSSCVSMPEVTREDPTPVIDYNAQKYMYPFGQEVTNATAEIMIKLNNVVPDNIEAVVPALKYNKSLLFMLTQDDCKQVAYSCTWAAINGKPLTRNYFYNAPQLEYGDLPPDIYYLGKTLGCTDGSGNEVRFSFTTTLMPEDNLMNAKIIVTPNFTDNYYRFKMKSYLVWNNVREMLNYGVGIAFHDVEAPDVNDPALIKAHYMIAQDSILNKLSDRGCKMLAEPNGNKTYVTAAQDYDPIQTLVVQRNGPLYPFQEESDLKDVVLNRIFVEPFDLNYRIRVEADIAKEDRQAIYVGVHSTSPIWAYLLLWLNDNYGQDGDDSLWFPSQEEYYEYTYYRKHGKQTITKVDDNTIKLTVTLPSGQYFYYPSITVNLKGLHQDDIASVTSSDAVTGLSYGTYDEGTMINLDCRKFLVEHAEHFVAKYEKDKTNDSNKADAIYFTNMLKVSTQKAALLKRME